jgi:putative hydrolase of the HAD superfamily
MSSEGDRPRAVFFDVGETLVRPRQPYAELLKEVSHLLGIHPPAPLLMGLAARIYDRVTERTELMLPFTFPAAASQRFWYETYHDFFARFLSGADARRLALALLDVLSSPSGYVFFDETVETLTRLRDDGFRLGIISNWEAWLPTLLNETGIASFFEAVVVSGICGCEKPDPRIFTLALEEGRYRPEEVVYVGDRPAHDVAPARQAGITPILLDRDNRYPDYIGPHRIVSLCHLPPILKQGLANRT